MEKKSKKINKIYFVYLAIIVLQLLNMLYWAGMKENYHTDELFSMGYASSYTGVGDTVQYLTDSRYWKYNEWINNKELKEYLLVSEEESILRYPFLQAVVKIVKGRNYLGLLNLAESISGNHNITKWPAIYMNFIFFIVADIILIAIFTRLKMSRPSICLFLALFGFCGYIIGLANYIRFYMLIIMLNLTIILLHQVIWSTDKMWKMMACELGSLAMAYLSLKNSELTVVFVCALLGSFWIGLLVTKKWKKLLVYSVPLFLAVVYLALKTKWLDILFNITQYMEMYDKLPYDELSGILTNIMGASVISVMLRLIWIFNIFSDYFFGHGILFILFEILFTFLIFKTIRAGKPDKKVIEICKIALWIFWAVIMGASVMNSAWMIDNVLTLNSLWPIYGTWIKICIIIIVLLSVYVVLQVLRKLIKALKLNNEDGFIVILAGVFIIYSQFAVLAGLQWTRYYCFGFLTFVIILGYMADRMMKKYQSEQMIVYYGILLVLVVTGCLIPLKTRNIEYIYEEDRMLVNNLKSYQGMDTLLVSIVDENRTMSRHVVYDCVNLLDEKTRIYSIDMLSFEYDEEIFSDEFLLWTNIIGDVTELINEFEMNGYEVQFLAEDHLSAVFICRKL